jgi:serine/threonine protein kinase
LLGQGSYGEVVKAKCKATEELVAIKYVSDFDNEYDCVKAIREIKIMSELTNMPNNKISVKLIDLLITHFKKDG